MTRLVTLAPVSEIEGRLAQGWYAATTPWHRVSRWYGKCYFWRDVMLDWSRWPNFSPAEMACKGQGCCGNAVLMDPAFMDALQELRTALGFPLPISSGYRCPLHNGRVSTTGSMGPHTTGRAADIGVEGAKAWALLSAAMPRFTGIGIKQHGMFRFIHLDLVPGPPRPWVWSYA